MGKDPNERTHKPDSGERIDHELATSVSNLWGAVRSGARGGIHALYFRQKLGGVWTAVGKRIDPNTGQALVAFGTGKSIGSAAQALNAAIQQGQWKDDRPWVRD